MSESLKKKTAKGMIWSAVERFSTQGVQFVFGIILARLLTPADYGVIAMLTIFIAVSQTFIDSGLGNAVIRKIDRTEKDMSTMFFFNIGMSLVCYGVIFLIAPLAAKFYNMPELILILRVLALRLVIQAFSIAQITHLTIKINFKIQAKVSFVSAILSGIVGIIFAYRGYGVWSLVIQTLANSFLTSLLFTALVRWRPTSIFSIESFKYMFSFGSKILASGILETVYKNIYALVIGKFYSSAQLGNYAKADRFAQFPSSNLTAILQRVSFPVLSTLQNNPERLRSSYLKFINLSAFIVFPLMTGLLAIAKPMTFLLLTEKWSEMIPLLQIVCLSMMWYPVHAINLNVLQVLGRSDLFLRLEIIKKILGVTILCITLPMGIMEMCLGQIVSAWICLFINTYYSGKFLQAGYVVQMKFLFPLFVNSVVMAAIILGVNHFLPEKQYVLQIGVGFVVGVLYYFVVAYLFNRKTLNELLSVFKRK